jgi:alkanesulfonate monooxygenase SsuD/methylene tetrahydromethanopterin reductase-like flavin-dependent oxidoreductase (luciferase family)
MWREPGYRYDGRFFAMPERTVLPRLYTKPHPPIWMACGSPSTFERAARLGVGALCFSLGAPRDFAPLVKTYKENIRHAEPIGAYVNDNVACVTQLVCDEDPHRARRVAMTMGSGYHTSLVFRYLDTFPRPPGIPQWPALIPEPTPEALEERIASGGRVVGDPDEVARGVQLYADIGCDQLIFGILASTQPQATALRTVELFGRHVIPRFDTDPVHRTTRMREAAAR